MDRQTDGQTELRWLRRATAVAAVARNKTIHTLSILVNKKLYTVSPKSIPDIFDCNLKTNY